MRLPVSNSERGPCAPVRNRLGVLTERFPIQPRPHPTFAKCRTLNLPANSRNRSRLAARNLPISRPPASFDIRTPQASCVQPSLAKISATSVDIAALPSRSIRPVYSTNIKYCPSVNPLRIPSRTAPSSRRSSIGTNQSSSSSPPLTCVAATLPSSAACKSLARSFVVPPEP